MEKMNTKLMNEPKAFQVSFRIRALNAHYGQWQVEQILFTGRTYGIVRLEEIKRHTDNLMLTYGVGLVFEVFEMFEKKVG